MCQPRTEGATGLSDEWRPFAQFIDVCRLESPGSAPSLEIISASATRYYKDQPSGAVTVPLPKPIIRSTEQVEVGRLPYGYPDDPPMTMELTFSDWRDGRPRQIEVFVRDPTVSGDRHLTPMRWDSTTSRYVGGTEK